MPLVTVDLMPGRTEAQKDAFARRLTAAMCEELGTTPDQVWLIFREVEPTDWYTGEKSTAQVLRERDGN